MRTSFLAVCVLLSLSLTPSSASPTAEPVDEVALKIRALEERASRAEDRLARLEKQLAVTPPEAIPFGDVVVNLSEERQQRYLRVKIALRVSDDAHKEMTALVIKKKAALRSWAIQFLSDQTVKDVSGSKGVLRVQDELRKGFNAVLSDGKSNPIREVLFEEYIVQ